MARIFISYRRRATAGQAGRLYDRLKQAFGDHNVFTDITSIPAGETFESYILEEIKRSDVFLAMLSKGTLTKIQDPEDWVRREIAYALEQEHVRVIPVLVDGFKMPNLEDLPEDIQGITGRNAEFLRHELFDETAERIIQRIQGSPTSLAHQASPHKKAVNRGADKAQRNWIEQMIRSITLWIQSVANPDGGLPSDREGSASCTWTTSGLLWSSWNAGTSFQELYMRKALNWVLNNRNPDHGIPLVMQGDHSITDATAQTAIACSLALTELNEDLFKEGLKDCVNWLLYHRLGKTGWSWRPTPNEPCWIASTVFAMLGLYYSAQILTEKADEINDVLYSTILWVKSIRNIDGGWGSREGDPSRPAITGLVCSIMQEIDLQFDCGQSVSYILSRQDRDGSWLDTIDRPTGHTVTRLGTSNCIRALAECGYPISSENFQRALSALVRTYQHSHFCYPNTDILSWPTRDGLLALASVGRLLNLPTCRNMASMRRTQPAVSNKPPQSRRRDRKKKNF